MILYHGSPSEFYKFDEKYLNTSSGLGWDSLSKLGFCFTPSLELAKTFGYYIYQCEIEIKNPLIIDMHGEVYEDWLINHHFKNIVGYDSIKLEECMDGGMLLPASIVADQYCVFDTNSIKILSIEYNYDFDDEVNLFKLKKR